MHIYIKALNVINHGNGTYAIELPHREMTQEERTTILRLFPRLSEQAFTILEQEALLDAVAGPADVVVAQNQDVPSSEVLPSAKSKGKRNTFDPPATDPYK